MNKNNKKFTIYLLAGFLCLFGWPTVAHAQSSTTTIRGMGLQPLVEERGTTQTLNIYGPGGAIIAQVATDSPAGGTPTTQTRYLLHDHLGSTRVVLDSNNQVLGSFDYSPFGETTVSNGAAGNVANVAYRYTGQEVNDGLGTYNYHARHYDAGVGRFLRVDPARQFASSYAYVGNNPINLVDLNGRQGRPLIIFGHSIDRSGALISDPILIDSAELGVDIFELSLRTIHENLINGRQGVTDIRNFFPELFNGHILVASHFTLQDEVFAFDGADQIPRGVRTQSLGREIGNFLADINYEGVPVITSLGCRAAQCDELSAVARGIFVDSNYAGDTVQIASVYNIAAGRSSIEALWDPSSFPQLHLKEKTETFKPFQPSDGSPAHIHVSNPTTGVSERRGFTRERYASLIHHGSTINDVGVHEVGFVSRVFHRADFELHPDRVSAFKALPFFNE